jgi:hypothetical protein
MTRKEKIFRHIEDSGNAMRYTDIIKFAYEEKYGKGTFDKIGNRGFYASAFNYHSYWSNRFDDRIKNIGKPKGHFVTPTKNGHLVKLSNGLWSVHRPLGWNRENGNCETYEARIEKFLSDGKEVVERDIVAHIKPYPNQYRKIGYDWGSTNNLLRKMIKSGKVYRISCLNEKTGRFAYHYGLVDTAIQSTTSSELGNKIKRSTEIVESLETGITILSKEVYDDYCDVLAKYNISADTFDNLATDYFSEGNDAMSAYHFAYYDLLTKALPPAKAHVQFDSKKIESTPNLEEDQSKDTSYIIIDAYSVCVGIVTAEELIHYFQDKETAEYTIYEIAKETNLEKKVTTSITIK